MQSSYSRLLPHAVTLVDYHTALLNFTSVDVPAESIIESFRTARSETVPHSGMSTNSPSHSSLFCWSRSLPRWPESVPRTSLNTSPTHSINDCVSFPPPLRKVTGRFLSPNKNSTVFSAILWQHMVFAHAQFLHRSRPRLVISAPYNLISALSKVSYVPI